MLTNHITVLLRHNRCKSKSKKTILEAIVIIQIKGGGLDLDGSGGGG